MNTALQQDNKLFPELYRINFYKKFVLVQFYPTISMESLASFNNKLRELVLTPQDIVFDCFHIDKIPSSVFFSIQVLNQLLLASNKKVVFINTTPEIKAKLNASNFDPESSFYESYHKFLFEGLSESDEEKQNVTFMKALILSTVKTMFVQSSIPCIRRKSYFKEKEDINFSSNFNGAIKIELEDNQYVFNLSFPEETYTKVISYFLDEECHSIDESNEDAVLELVNIILGQMKSFASSNLGKGKTSFPVLIKDPYTQKLTFGADKDVFNFDGAQSIVVPFFSTFGKFYVEVFFPEEYSNDRINTIISM